MCKRVILLLTLPFEGEETNLPRWVERKRQKQQPLGLGVIASQIVNEMRESVEVKIIDYYSRNDSTIENVLETIKREHKRGQVAVVGISCSSPLLRQAYRLVKGIKADPEICEIKVALGGHAANCYFEEIKQWHLLDAIFLRNGNLSFLEYVRHVVADQPIPEEGAFVLTNGTYSGRLPSEEFLVRSVKREAPVDYRLFDDSYGFAWEGEFASIFTSYGCPYSCSFCTEADSLRYYTCNGNEGFRDINIIRQEVESLRELGCKRVSIVNDSLLNETERWREIVDTIHDNGMEFEIRARVDQLIAIGPENLRSMIDKGLRRVFVGGESASDEALAFLRKRITAEHIQKAFSYLREGKRYHKDKGYSGEFSSVVYIMLGLKKKNSSGGIEEETLGDVLRSVWLPFKLRADYAHYATLTLYPGTFLYEEWLRDGAEDYWQQFYEHPDMLNALPLYPYKISRSAIVSLAYVLFYIRPRFWPFIVTTLFRGHAGMSRARD